MASQDNHEFGDSGNEPESPKGTDSGQNPDVGNIIIPHVDQEEIEREELEAERHKHRRRMSREHVKRIHRRCRIRRILIGIVIVIALLAALGAWFAASALKAKNEIAAAVESAGQIQTLVENGDTDKAKTAIQDFSSHIDAAYKQTKQPVWAIAGLTPYYGSDVRAVREVVSIMENVSNNALPKLAASASAIDFNTIGVKDGTVQLGDMGTVAQDLDAANQFVSDANVELSNISGTHVSQVTEALDKGKTKFAQFASMVDTVHRMADIMPSMFDLDQTGKSNNTPRTYLVIAQNNAELRATGGIPASWSTLSVNQGKLDVGTFNVPPTNGMYSDDEAGSVLTPDERSVMSRKMATDFQDINFTPDFPRTATLASSIWSRAGNGNVDGVISVDPVFLQHLLKVTGPVTLTDGTVLNGDNAAQIILNQTYIDKASPDDQNAFFSMAATQVFKYAVHNLDGKNKQLIETVRKGVSNGHVYLWSAHQAEQKKISGTTIAGELASSPSKPVAGVYFNDGTMAKMDWYLKREVTSTYDKTYADGSKQYTIHVKLTNTANAAQVNAAPDYLRGYDQNDKPRHGEIETIMYVFAPNEGQIVDMNPKFDQTTTYDNLPLIVKSVHLEPGESFEATVHVVASPKAGDNALILRQTPLVD